MMAMVDLVRQILQTRDGPDSAASCRSNRVGRGRRPAAEADGCSQEHRRGGGGTPSKGGGGAHRGRWRQRRARAGGRGAARGGLGLGAFLRPNGLHARGGLRGMDATSGVEQAQLRCSPEHAPQLCRVHTARPPPETVSRRGPVRPCRHLSGPASSARSGWCDPQVLRDAHATMAWAPLVTIASAHTPACTFFPPSLTCLVRRSRYCPPGWPGRPLKPGAPGWVREGGGWRVRWGSASSTSSGRGRAGHITSNAAASLPPPTHPHPHHSPPHPYLPFAESLGHTPSRSLM